MKPSIIFEELKKSMLALVNDKQDATNAIEGATNALGSIVKPANYDVHSTIQKLGNITRAVSLSQNESEALNSIGVTCEGKLTKEVRENLKKVSAPYFEVCKKYDDAVCSAKNKIAELEKKLSSIEGSATALDMKRDNALGKFLTDILIGIAGQFGVKAPTGRLIAELKAYALKASNDDLSEFEDSLVELAKCDSSKSPDAPKSYLVGLELPYLSEFIGGLGAVVAAPVVEPDLTNDGALKPPTEPVRKNWKEFAVKYDGEVLNRDTVADKAFTRLMALSRRIVKHAQKGTLSTIRAAEKSGLLEGRVEQIVFTSVRQFDKILQGAVNIAVRQAVETSGKDLSALNCLTSSPVIYKESTGFNLHDFRAYIEDVLPHLEFKKGVWVMRSQRALENRGLGAFGVHLFGQVPARLITDKPPLFPVIDWLQFRELKKLYSKEVAAANKAAKADYANAWREFEESFPIEHQLATLETQLENLEKERNALAEKAAKLKAAM